MQALNYVHQTCIFTVLFVILVDLKVLFYIENSNLLEMKLTISLVLLYLYVSVVVIFGVYYLLSTDIMPYHYAFLQETNESLSAYNPALRSLYVSLMRVCGGGYIAIGLAGVFLISFPYRQGAKWAWWALFTLTNAAMVPVLYVSYQIATSIAAGGVRPPWWLAAALLAMACIALLINFTPGRRMQEIVI